jgi:hypothetical protein
LRKSEGSGKEKVPVAQATLYAHEVALPEVTDDLREMLVRWCVQRGRRGMHLAAGETADGDDHIESCGGETHDSLGGVEVV